VALQHLNQAYHNKASGIRKWNFAHRLTYTKETKLDVMQACISTLYAKVYSSLPWILNLNFGYFYFIQLDTLI